MSYNSFLNETCTIYTVVQAPDVNGMTTETETAIYTDIKCLKEDISYSNRFSIDKDGNKYTDVFYTQYLENAKDIDAKYSVLHEGKNYKVIQAVNPVKKKHHTEVYVERIT